MTGTKFVVKWSDGDLGRFQEFPMERYGRSVDRVHDSTPSGLCRFLFVVHRRQSDPISPVGKCVSRLAGICVNMKFA
jgi:hypothetical protein